MTNNAIIVRYAEVFLKGGRRSFFTGRMKEGLERRVKAVGPFKVRERHGHLQVVHAEARGDSFPPFEAGPELLDAVGRTFGVVSFSPCVMVPRELSRIEEEATRIGHEDVKGAESFKVATTRSDKDFPLDSMELNKRLGSAVAVASGVPVRMKEPAVTVHCKILRKTAALYVRVLEGRGGLPVGTAGRVALLLSGGIDSPVAGYLAMRRGCDLDAVHFESAPYTTPQARKKVEDLAAMLAVYQKSLLLYVVPFGSIQAGLRDHAPARLLVVLYRRFMMRIASRLAVKSGALGLVTGENLGQVASQTLENMAAIEAVASLPVLRPLLTYDKMETVDLARSIGTYETSILPYDDCCSLFVPRHPETAARIEAVVEAEDGLDVEGMVSEAVAAVEVLKFPRG